MYQVLNASEIRKRASLEARNCSIIIDGKTTIQMVYETVKGAVNGVRWYFICPNTGKRCRQLSVINGCYIHMSGIKNYYRRIKPAWYKDTPLTKILVKKQKQIDAE